MSFQEQLAEVIESFDSGALDETRLLLESLTAQEIANLLTSTPPHVRHVLWELLGEETAYQALGYLHDDVRADLLESMQAEELIAALEEIDYDDFVDILQQLPATLTQEVLAGMDATDRARVEAILAYPEDSAGGLMNADAITVQPRHSVELVLRYLRLRKELPDALDALIVVNESGAYLGIVAINRLLTADPTVTVREIMDTEIEPILVDTLDHEVARIFSEQDRVSAPVVDGFGQVLGRITIDDVVDVILEDADEAILAPKGLDTEDDTFAPVLKSVRRRSIWLGINLLTAFLAASVINAFEATIAEVVALAVLMPMVASMGGVAGSQVLVLVIRGMALGQISRANLGYLVNREIAIAALNGVLVATVVAGVAALAFRDARLGGIIAAAMVINLMVAAIAGSVLPGVLRRLDVDPAIAGGVVLTTITDVTGFFVFLGLATLVYL